MADAPTLDEVMRVLADAAIPLEVLHGLEAKNPTLSPSLREGIAYAVANIRDVVHRAALRASALAPASEPQPDMKSEVTRLRSALANWGRHFAWCATNDRISHPCNCGFAEVLR